MALAKLCPCGRPNPADALFCADCGGDLSLVEPQDSPAPPSGSSALPPQEAASPAFPEGAPSSAGGVERAALLAEPPGPETPVKLCGSGHVNPPDAVLCLEPGCLEDIALSPILRYGDIVLGAAGGGGEAPAPGPHRPLGAADGPSGAFAGAEETEEEPEIFYPEEELVLRLDTGAQFAVRSGDTVGRLAKGSECLEAFPTVSRRHMAVEFREGLWFLRNLSTNGTYVNGALLDVGGEHEVRPGDDLRLSTRCRLTVVP